MRYFLCVLACLLPVTAQTAAPRAIFTSMGNDTAHVDFTLFDDGRFSIICEFPEVENAPEGMVSYVGHYREWPNLFDLHFEEVTVDDQPPRKMNAATIDQLFLHSWEAGSVKQKPLVRRIPKNPIALFICGPRMELLAR